MTREQQKKITIADILKAQNVFCNVTCGSKKGLFDSAAHLIAENYHHIGRQEVFDCLCARERLGSTDLGNGMALPHGRLSVPSPVGNSAESATTAETEHISAFHLENDDILTAFLHLGNAIDYEAEDKRPVDLVFVLITPEQTTETHLAILALLAKTLGCPELIEKLRACQAPAKTYALLAGQ